MKRLHLLICFLIIISANSIVANAGEIPWKAMELISGGRIDAIAYAGNNVVIAGTRNPNPGWIFYSRDNGITWQKGQHLNSSEELTGITCIASARDGLCFAINESSELFRSADYGKTWTRLRKVSSGSRLKDRALSYGLCITKQGTLLISDTNADGGFVFRSTDNGETFTKSNPISSTGLYRFDLVRNGIVVNGWAGSVYKSEDDGINWQLWSKMDSTALYATEYLRPETIIQASAGGYVHQANLDKKDKFTTLAKPGGEADDFVYIGYNTLIYSTYTASKSVFISYDRGKTWIDDGPVPTGAKGDWLDHVISLELGDSIIAIGGTNKGFIVRTAFFRGAVYSKTFDNKKFVYDESLKKDFEKGIIGSLYDPKELDEPEDVLLDGNVAYVPCRGSNNLAVIDVSNPHNPQLLSSFRDPELADAMGVSKFRNYIYISSFSNRKCLVVDASDPKKLKKIYSFTVGAGGPGADRLRKVVYHDGYLYLTHDDESRLYIADAKNPARPKVISSVSTGDDGAFAVFVKGNYAYTGGCFSEGPVKVGRSVRVIDISDKKHPQLVSSVIDSARYGCTCSFQEVGKDLVDVAYSSNSLVVFDISNPAKPLEKGFLRSDQMYGPGRVKVMGNKAYVINSINDCFVQVDLSSPDKPAIDYVAPSWKLKKVYGLDGRDGLLYMAGRDSRYFLIVDPSKY
ncbi:MAG: hypothetical protein J7497_03860 [Chitinophagaceae bacterium]|nr:hypothetical protein [Chitinophagaceae bacterium]